MANFLDQYFSFFKHILPDQKQVLKPSVGLDIGVHSCKVIEIMPAGSSFVVLNWAIEPTGPNPADTVRRILAKLDIQSKSPTSAVYGQGSLIRYVDMPKMSLEEIRKSFDLEVDKYFPFSRDQIQSDCFIVGPSAKENKLAVLVAAAKKDIIEHRIQLLSSLGLKAEFIGMNSVAIANAFHILSSPSPTPAVSAILDMGESLSSLVIMYNNLPRFTRDIFIGGRDLTKRISNALSIDFAEAEKNKCKPEDKLESILAACESSVMNLISEIKLSFDYFAEENNAAVSNLYVTGGGSQMQGFIPLLEKHLEVPTIQWNPFTTLKLANNVSPQEINQHASRLAAALGLALYQHE